LKLKRDSYPLRIYQGSNIPGPPKWIGKANIACSESLGGWRHSLVGKCKWTAFSSGVEKDDRSLTVLVKNVQWDDKPWIIAE